MRLAVILLCAAGAAAQAQTDAPVNDISADGFVTDWLLLGPLPSEEITTPGPDGVTRLGFTHDYLRDFGGEARAIIAGNTELTAAIGETEPVTVAAQPAQASASGRVNLAGAFGGSAVRVAYAFCYIRSEVDQRVYFHLGSDDAAKVWINHELALSHWTVQRGCHAWDNNFAVDLHEGLNPVLVKIDDRGGGWEFMLEAYTAADNERKLAERFLRGAADWPVQPTEERFMFLPGQFPEIEWAEQAQIERLLGAVPLSVRWFDAAGEPVQSPTAPGRYGAVIDAETPEGVPMRRAMTGFCAPGHWRRIDPDIRVDLSALPLLAEQLIALGERADLFEREAGQLWLDAAGRSSEGAALLAAVWDAEPTGGPATAADSPRIADHDYHLMLKRRLLGVDETTYPALQPVNRRDTPATVLREGTPAEAGMAEDVAERLNDVCSRWYAASELPFDVVVARRGVIVFHQGYGELMGEPVTGRTRFPMASITKTLTAQLFAQFLDQGLIGLDEPVGRYLPALPAEGEDAITFRMCYTFTTGLRGHGSWGGVDNPWLEYAVLAELPHIQPGRESRYNGDGHNLAGAAMAVVSGRSILRLMHEQVFLPMGIEDVVIEDCAYGTLLSAEELARLSQVILNGGSYGDLQFYRPETRDLLLPVNVEQWYPDFHDARGIGLYLHGQGLGPNTVGGAAASSTIQRIDPDNELVITVGRVLQGKDYDQYVGELFQTVMDSLED